MKLERHSKIVELIGKYEIETQEELAEHLKQAGYKVTQATVSRDIREIMNSQITKKMILIWIFYCLSAVPSFMNSHFSK